MQKYLYIFLVIGLLGYGTTLAAFAHDGSFSVAEFAGSLEVEEPTILPDSPLYFFKNLGRGVRLLFTFDPVKKAELELKFADEKIAEVAKLVTAKPDADEALSRALENYLEAHQRLEAKLGSLQGQNKNVDRLLENLADRTLKHKKLFHDLEDEFTKDELEKVSEEIAKGVKKALELDKKKFKDELKKKIDDLVDENLANFQLFDDLQELEEELGEELDDLEEDEVEDIRGEAKEAAKEEIEEAKEEITEAEAKAQKATAELKQSTESLLKNAGNKLREAEEAYAAENFGRAYGLANAAQELAENALRQLEEASGQDLGEKTEIPEQMTVTIDANGNFSPAGVKIKKGGTVIWTNRSSSPVWPASALHPTHQLYPGFDARRGLAGGESYSFVFDRTGVWKYHNHLRPAVTGTVEVQD